jgi:hypothetical protein
MVANALSGGNVEIFHRNGFEIVSFTQENSCKKQKISLD